MRFSGIGCAQCGGGCGMSGLGSGAAIDICNNLSPSISHSDPVYVACASQGLIPQVDAPPVSNPVQPPASPGSGGNVTQTPGIVIITPGTAIIPGTPVSAPPATFDPNQTYSPGDSQYAAWLAWFNAQPATPNQGLAPALDDTLHATFSGPVTIPAGSTVYLDYLGHKRVQVAGDLIAGPDYMLSDLGIDLPLGPVQSDQVVIPPMVASKNMLYAAAAVLGVFLLARRG